MRTKSPHFATPRQATDIPIRVGVPRRQLPADQLPSMPDLSADTIPIHARVRPAALRRFIRRKLAVVCKRPNTLGRAPLAILAVGLLMCGAFWAGTAYRHRAATSDPNGLQTLYQGSAKGSGRAPAPQQLTKEKPPYKTLLPAGKSADALGGWKRISPPDRAPVYAYADSIGTTHIAVSQQPLPSAFKTNTEQKIAQMATDFSANDIIDYPGGKAYLGTSVEGPQSVIFTKSGLLILIKSTSPIDKSIWVQYITSLR